MVRLDRKERCGPVTTLAIKQASSSPLVGLHISGARKAFFFPPITTLWKELATQKHH